MAQIHYTRDDIAARGQSLYEEQIRPLVEAEHKGKILVVDVETGHYEIDTDELAALRRARDQNVDASLYLLRIGYPTAYRLGQHSLSRKR